MGYYKKLSSEGRRRYSSSERKLNKPQNSGNAVDINLTVDIEKMVLEFQRIGNYKSLKRNAVKAIHTKVAQSGARSMRKAVVDYPRTIEVRRSGRFGGKAGPDIDITPGTLSRSIAPIDPGNGTNMWLGPRSSAVNDGVRAGSTKDGWFAHIVDAGDQYLGPGVNKNFFNRGLAKGRTNMERALRRNHAKALNKHVTK